MGVPSCQIVIYKTSNGVHCAGDIVRGKVKYFIDKPTRFQAITLSLLGIGKCNWQESGDETSFYTNTEEYVNVHYQLIPNLVTLQGGYYEHDFQLRLPDNAPSSYKDKHCSIVYRIRMKFEKTKLFGATKKFKTELPVHGYVTPAADAPVHFTLQKSLFKPFSLKNHEVNLSGHIEKQCLSPGEYAKVYLRVENCSDEQPAVKLDLYCDTTLFANNRKRKLRKKVKGCGATTYDIKERSTVHVTLTVPIKAELSTIHCKVVKKEYKLRGELQLSAFHRNAVVNVPVVIGVRRGVKHHVPTSHLTYEARWEAMAEY